MPELPDIEMYLNALRERVLGEPLERVRVSSPFVVRSYDPPMSALHGQCVTGFRRIGKRIVFELQQELFLVVHLMVAGRFKEKSRGAAIPRRLGLLALDFPKLTLLLTEASKKKRASVYAVRGEQALAEHDPGGIDVMHCSLQDFAEALTRENHTLKRTMTDPHVFSGIGNGYSDEILHHAQLSPVKWTTRLSEEEMKRLFLSTKEILALWSERLDSERKGAFPEKVTAFRPEMAVHGKHKQPCPRCGAPVQRIVRGQSEINYCAPCQTGGKLLADRALSRLLKGDWPKTLEALEERMEQQRAALVGRPAPASSSKRASGQQASGGRLSLTEQLRLRRQARAASSVASDNAPAATETKTSAMPKRAKAKSSPTKAPAKSTQSKAAAKKAHKPAKKKRAAKPLLLFAHGAGASSSSDWMKRWAKLLGDIGKVVPFDYPYMAEGRRRPDRHDKLVAAHADALARARKRHRGKVILIGKSMGGRIGCHLSLQQPVDALVCLGYPLVGIGKTRKLRDEVLKQLSTPVLFVQGTRDKMCPLDVLDEVRTQMSAESQLHVVETGDHSLLVTKTWQKQTGLSQQDADFASHDAIAAFIASN